MKYHIAFKFLAVLLCAACLMTAIGSGLGIFVMTETGLYERSVEEIRQERLESTGISFAQGIAQRYASIHLGGCPEELARYSSAFNYGFYSYQLMDADGNVLDSEEYTGMNTNNAVTYEFFTAGNYMHVLSMTPESELQPDVEIEFTQLDGETYLYDAIPYDGVQVYRLSFSYENGSEGMSGDEPVGILHYSEQGNGAVIFRAYHSWFPSIDENTTLTGICFYDENDELLYESSAPTGVGYFYRGEDDGAVFESLVMEEITHVTLAPTEAVAWGVAKEVVNIHATPSVDSNADGYLKAGDEIEILVLENVNGTEWGFIDEDAGSGWVCMDYIALLDAPTEETEAETGSTEPQLTEVVTEPTTGRINAYVNVHASPNVNSLVVGQLSVDSDVEILTRETVDGTEWGWIAGAGWILLDQVTLSPVGEPVSDNPADTSASTVTGVTEEALNIYRDPNLNGEVVGRFHAGTTVELLLQETVGDTLWGQTDLGWIMLDYVTVFADENSGISTASETGADIAAAEPTMAKAEPEETAAATVPETVATEEATVPATVPETTTAPEVSPTPEAAAFAEEPTIPEDIILLDDTIHTTSYYDYEAQERVQVEYVNAQMPEYTVVLTLAPGALSYESFYDVLELVWPYRSDLLVILGVSILLFAIMAVYLCCAAGKKPRSEEVRAAGLNCIPLDLYLVVGIIGISCLFVVIAEGGNYLLRQELLVGCAFCVGMAYLACLLFVGFCFAFAAQVKTPGGYWCTNTLLCRCLTGCFAAAKWLLRFCGRSADAALPLGKRFFGWLCRMTVALFLFGKKTILALYELVKKVWLWLWALVKKWTGKLWKAFCRFLSMLPLTWQWLLAGFAIFLLLALVFATNGEELLVVLCLAAAVAIILYGAHSFGTLWESTKAMSKGDLDTKVDDKLLFGCFQEFAGDLNALADVAVVAAQKQLKSERMKTELITNVSHDIKTPLTSIINYVDLLQKPHTDKEQEQYLEVLDRQSQRLKKLIDDLMEMSKANTGNMAVDITKVDAIESVNQALGEFADKLDKAQLIPVFRRPDEPVAMMADGRLVWRVMSNLLSNAVKYALPGTRLYIDLMELEGKVIISLKNISREELNVDADELMERFVRGDDSRNTEGSGLGLNIAKSLMELQRGQLQLLVDGDLFKVTLIFPGA